MPVNSKSRTCSFINYLKEKAFIFLGMSKSRFAENQALRRVGLIHLAPISDWDRM